MVKLNTTIAAEKTTLLDSLTQVIQLSIIVDQ